MDLIQLQEEAGGVNAKIESKYESKKICNMVWKKIKFLAMTGDKNPKQINIPLNEHEQYLLQRYIDAERQEPDFIARGLSLNFLFEVFLYIYYAGHGCSDNMQYFVLNGQEVDKIFYPAEYRIKKILARAGSNCKSMVVYDCCREDYAELRKKIIETHKEIEA